MQFSRRDILTALSAMPIALGATSLLAASEASTRALVDKLVADVNKVIASGKSETAMFADFKRIFMVYSDLPTIAKYALGNDARSASKAQLNAFIEAFSDYISVKYGKRFREFIGGKIEVNGSRKVKSFYEVKTTAYLRGQAPFEVVFLVSDKSGKDLFFNMFIEGVNMLLTERTEIGAMMDRNRGDLDKTIADLKKAR